MPGLGVMEVPAGARRAGLVSVDGRSYPLESARVEAHASGGIVLSTLVQKYKNPYPEILDVSYTLPLPADAAVVGYVMTLGDRVIRGEVRKRAEARAEFEKALVEGRTAALLEQERDDTFTQRLGSLPAGQSAEITIEVLHPLQFLVATGGEGCQWQYRFPTVVGVRYQGAEGRVPDAETLEVDRSESSGAIPTRIELALSVTGADGETIRRIDPMPLDRDLVVRFPAAGPKIGAHLVEGTGLPGDSGRYGLVTITPPSVPEVQFARDVTLLIDASGSMSGPPIEWAKGVAAGLLDSLNEGDRFEIITFASRPVALTKGLVPADRNALDDARRALASVSASGGTEMVKAVIDALKPLRRGSQHQVVLITDGQIGFEDEVVAQVVRALPDGARLHLVGVGAAPNRTLTCRAARAGRGTESFVCGNDDLEGAVRRLVVATARPVLTDIRIESAAVRGVAPARPRDVLAGQPLVVAVELQDAGGALEVTGNLAGSNERWRWQLDLPPASARGKVVPVPLGALYGRETIADLEIARGPSDEQVERVALRHRIASRMTSLIAIAEEPTVDPRLPKRRETLPIEVPAYQSAEMLGLGEMRFRFKEASYLLGASLDEEESLSMPAHSVRSLRRTLWERTGSGQTALQGRVLLVEGNLLVIEYESPEDGFFGPEPSRFETSGTPRVIGALDVNRSSPRGPHARGLLLRIAVRRATGKWSAGDRVVLRWASGTMSVIERILEVVIPEPTDTGGTVA